MMTTMYKWMVASWLLCGPVFGEAPSQSWGACREQGLRSGLSGEKIDKVLEACRRNQLTAAETETLLQPVVATGAEGLAADCVLLKVEEGLAKKIPWQTIHGAAVRRMACLREAERLVEGVGLSGRGGQERLVVQMGVAIESGLPPEVLSRVLNTSGEMRYGRLIHVIDAGETLQLEGLDAPAIERIMLECLERDLNRSEVLRVVDFVITAHASGQKFAAIHAALWGSSESSN